MAARKKAKKSSRRAARASRPAAAGTCQAKVKQKAAEYCTRATRMSKRPALAARICAAHVERVMRAEACRGRAHR